MAEYTLKVRRFQPESGEGPYWEEFKVELDRVLVPVGRLAGLGVIAAQAEGELLGWAVVCFGGHQYFLSSGCHWVMVTGE